MYNPMHDPGTQGFFQAIAEASKPIEKDESWEDEERADAEYLEERLEGEYLGSMEY